MDNQTKYYLGQIVYCVMRDGKIRRTAIGALSIDGYELLDCRDALVHAFTFEAARIKANGVVHQLLKSPDLTRREEALLREYLILLGTDAHRLEVQTQPLTQRHKGLLGLILPGTKEVQTLDIEFPTEYFKPGQTVYGLVSPLTHPGRLPMSSLPRPYLVLVVVVERVVIAPVHTGLLFYHFKDSNYSFSTAALFATETEAREALAKLFANETGGEIALENILVYPAYSESEARRKRIDAAMKSQSHFTD